MAPQYEVTRRSIRVLGILWVIYGIIRLAIGVWLALFGPTATLMFGALLSRVAHPFALMNGFHIVYGLLIVWSLACGILGLVAGWWLLAGDRFGRTLALVAAFFSLGHLPMGTTLGIYTLIVLLPWKVQVARRPEVAE